MWKNDTGLFEVMKTKLYTPVVGDILDGLSSCHQFLPMEVQPLTTDMRLAGRAMPVLATDVYGEQEKPFGKLCEALDQIESGEIYICGGGGRHSAYWGEILTATAKARGGNGAVVYGPHRDTPRVLEQNWPVFSTGRWAQDSRVRTSIQDFRCAIEIEGVWIEPGDLVFGDLDGVVIIPKRLEKEVITKALEKVAAENCVRKDIEAGMSSADAFEKHGVL